MGVRLSITGEETIDAEQAAESLKRLKALYRSVKREHTMGLSDATVTSLDKLRKSNCNQFEWVLRLYVTIPDISFLR
jgi:hypothetical protein